jgi:hypothetical protein
MQSALQTVALGPSPVTGLVLFVLVVLVLVPGVVLHVDVELPWCRPADMEPIAVSGRYPTFVQTPAVSERERKLASRFQVRRVPH